MAGIWVAYRVGCLGLLVSRGYVLGSETYLLTTTREGTQSLPAIADPSAHLSALLNQLAQTRTMANPPPNAVQMVRGRALCVYTRVWPSDNHHHPHTAHAIAHPQRKHACTTATTTATF